MTDTPILRTLSAAVGAPDAAPDGELLRRFAEAADRTAFELVVRRHAEMVWGVCRAALARDRHAAEDAFQATFLILARKAATIRDASAAGWLFRVARNVAVRARARAARRDAHPLSETLAAMGETAEESASRGEIAPLVMEELDRLAARFREPVVLCFFEGHTHAEAAARLGWPIGTVASRLARAKDMLRDRLTRRGVVLPAAALGPLFVPTTGTAAPALLIRSAVGIAAGLPGRVPPTVLSLTEGVLSAMRYAKLKSLVAVTALIAGLTAALAGVPAATAGGADPTPPSVGLLVSAGGATQPVGRPAGDKKEKELEAKELKLLGGEWRAVKVEIGGQEIPADQVAKRRITIVDDLLAEVRNPNGGARHEVKISLSPGKSPKEIDITPLDGPDKDKTFPGIYKLDGDQLTICLPLAGGESAERPKKFEADKTNGLTVLERVKDEKEERQALAGEWTITKVLAAGTDDPAGQVGKTRWIFEDARVRWLEPNAISPIMGLKLDPAATPPTIDFLTTDGKEVRLSGIYFRQGDKLTVCIRFRKSSKKDRPGELKPADEVNYMILERDAKQGDPVVRP